MEKRRVLLICSQHLFGESIERILRAEEDVELIGPWSLGEDICQHITEASPDVILIADDSQSEAGTSLISNIIEAFPEMPIIRAGLNENVFRVFSAHTLPARGPDLIETIRHLPVITSKTSNSPNERSE